MLILAGPSGAGKSSLVERIIKEYPLQIEDTVTFTTRAMRAGEQEGAPYHFVIRSRFEELIKQDYFVEWAEVHGNLYGTPHQQIFDIWSRSRMVVMDVDVQGARTFKGKYPQALAVFIHPPNIEALRERLRRRDGEKLRDLELRLENARIELAQADWFDCQLVNQDFENCYHALKKIIEDHLKGN